MYISLCLQRSTTAAARVILPVWSQSGTKCMEKKKNFADCSERHASPRGSGGHGCGVVFREDCDKDLVQMLSYTRRHTHIRTHTNSRGNHSVAMVGALN